jgi:hypothetical protein
MVRFGDLESKRILESRADAAAPERIESSMACAGFRSVPRSRAAITRA